MPDSEKVNAVSESAEVLYVRLLTVCDDNGRYVADPRWIVAKVFTSRGIVGQVNAEDIALRIDELATAGLIVTYESDGKPYLEIIEHFRHSRRDTKPDLRFPAPPETPVTNPRRIRYGCVTNV